MEEIKENTNTPQNSSNKKKKRIIIITSVIVIIAILGGFVYKYFEEKKNRENEITLADDSATAVDYAYGTFLASDEDYKYWAPSIFATHAYDEIEKDYKRAIVKIFMDNKYTETGEYFLSKIETRGKSTFAFGNFTGSVQKKPDMAFLVEKSDYASSALYIISHDGNVLYWKEYSQELPIINSFSQGSKIFMDKMELEPSPLDGLIIKNKNDKRVVLYDSKTKNFENFYQYTNDDIKAAREEASYRGDEDIIVADSIAR
ncbi:uncharacterized protein CHSO_0875 [Chryseobacterium sp. StRB126]|uniref:hypothetical protein n=1 Tax=Chryseobacterium sp. StRB126 TaxID=878220 RepID=UPI0004E9950C|nr:hypothetical protein [Chryseobacterium sp. StRB126]BAP29912.1 uncharacterized protein CHSO_0875 [Chryseobacterium sp. StRB126]